MFMNTSVVLFLVVLLSFVVTGLAPNYSWRAKFLANVGLVSQKHKKFSYLIELYRKLALLYFVTIQHCLCLFLGKIFKHFRFAKPAPLPHNLKGSFTFFLFSVRTHILDSNEVWYS